MEKKKWLSVASAFAVLGSMCAAPMQASAAEQMLSPTEISDGDLEDIIAINTFLLGITDEDEAEDIDINEDGRINAIDLTLAKQEMLRGPQPALFNLETDTWDIHPEEEKTVTFTVQSVGITDAVTLNNAAGSVVAEMHDDGTAGDAAANDGVYTAQTVMSSDTEKKDVFYAVSGELRTESIEISFFQDLSEDTFKAFLELVSKFSGMSFKEAVEFASQSEEITSYTVNDEEQMITYESIYGIEGCFIDPPESDVPTFGAPSKRLIEDLGIDYKEARNQIKSHTFTPTHPDKKDVIVLSPLRDADLHENVLADDAVMTGELLAEALDSKCDWFLNSDVTPELFENLDSYGTVIYISHGFPDKNGNPCISTGLSSKQLNSDSELFSNFIAQYGPDMMAGRAYWYTLNTEDFFCLTKDFFSAHYEADSLKDSLWCFTSCYSMVNNSLANVLNEKGAAAVTGHTNSASQAYCYQTLFETVINGMILSQNNIRKSVENAKRVYGEYDPYSSTGVNQFTMKTRNGQDNFRLVDSVSSKEYRSFPDSIINRSHKYKVIHQKLSWSQAKTYCENQGGHLATVTSEKEQKFLAKIISYYNHSDFYWLGASDARKEGTWEWVTGEAFSYNNWSSTSPNNFNHGTYGMENYLGMTGRNYFFANAFEWNDFADTTKDTVADYNTAFVCEWE